MHLKELVLAAAMMVVCGSVLAAEAPQLKVYASARGGEAGTDSDATTAVTLTWVISDYGIGASSTGPLMLEISETSDFATKTEVEVAASVSGAVPVAGTHKVTGLTAGALRYARLKATNDKVVAGTSPVFMFSTLTTRTSTDWVSRGTVRYVDNQDGSDETGIGSAERPYASIKRGAADVCQFDTLAIRPGKDYVIPETITFPNIPYGTEYAQVTVKSSVEGEQVVIDGGGTKIGIDAAFGGMYYKDLCISNCVSSTAEVGAGIRLWINGWGTDAEMWRLGAKIERCKFVNCIHQTASGGALYTKKAFIWDTDFVDCQAAVSAAAVYSTAEGKSSGCAEFHRCNFVGNIGGTLGASAGNGGAVVCAQYAYPKFFDCSFTSNRTDSVKKDSASGGAIYGAPVIVSNCTFRSNYAYEGGGAVYQRGRTGTQLLGCKFFDNVAGGNGNSNYNGGGAFYCWSDEPPIIRDCVFVGNSSTNQAGGAVTVGLCTELSGCSFTNNWTILNGGAVRIRNTVTNIVGCTFVGNTAGAMAGAALLAAQPGTNVLRNCLFARNESGTKGGAVGLNGTSNGSKYVFACLESCTFVRNSTAGSGMGGAVYGTYANASLTNCLFSANTAAGVESVYKADKGATFDLDHCFTEGDPKFVDAENGDYHLQASSPCRNAGTNHAWMVGATYLNPTNPKRSGRIAEQIVDIGCYEFWPTPGLMLILR